MTEGLIEYIIISVFTLVAIFSFLIGPTQMIKMILGNYVIGGVILWFQASLTILSGYLAENAERDLVGFSYETLMQIVDSSVLTLSLVLFVWLLILIFQKADLSLDFPADEIIQKSLFVFMIPLTVLSVVFSLALVLFGAEVFDMVFLIELATDLTQTGVMYNLIVLLPVWMTIHAWATIAILTYVKVQYQTMLEVD